MTIKHLDEYRDSALSRQLVEKINKFSPKKVRLMEVCGTHTVSIFRAGIRSILPETIALLSGPGCPVCVTDQREIDAFIELCKMDGVIITTFGDLMRVPGTKTSLQKERAAGRDIRIVYSTMDAVGIASKNPGKRVVFLKPQLFMNNSGEVISTFLKKQNIPPQSIAVIHDDLDIPLGSIKISQAVQPKGHKGIQSIVDKLGKHFWSIRFGTGWAERENRNVQQEAWVLEKFSEKEWDIVKRLKKMCNVQ